MIWGGEQAAACECREQQQLRLGVLSSWWPVEGSWEILQVAGGPRMRSAGGTVLVVYMGGCASWSDADGRQSGTARSAAYARSSPDLRLLLLLLALACLRQRRRLIYLMRAPSLFLDC